MVESDCYVRTQIGTVRLHTPSLKAKAAPDLHNTHFIHFLGSPQLDMPKEHLYANLETILIDVCSHRPADMGRLTETDGLLLH